MDVLFVLVAGAGSGLHDEIAGALVPCVRLGGVGSLLLVVLVVLVALALGPCVDLLLLVVLVALVALALGPCVGLVIVLVLGRVLAAVVLLLVLLAHTYGFDVGVLAEHLRGLCCPELQLFDVVAGEGELRRLNNPIREEIMSHPRLVLVVVALDLPYNDGWVLRL